MGCCDDCIKTLLKILLIIFNSIFFILGVVLLGLGIVVKTTLNGYVKPHLDPILQSLVKMPATFDTSSTSTAAPPSIDLVSLLGPLGAALIGIGVVLILITFFGCFGACCNSRCLLIIYIVIYGIFVLVQCILVGLFFTKKLDNQIRKMVRHDLVDKYVDFEDYTMPSIICNVVQLKFSCCGIDNYKDYDSVTSWKRIRYLTINGLSLNYNLTTPLTCCKTKGDFPSVTFPDTTCATSPTDLNNNWKTGCWSEVGNFLEKYRSGILAGVIIAIIVEVLFIVMAAIVCCLSGSKVGSSEYA